jgi:2-methylcitrate dehydratase PrpD
MASPEADLVDYALALRPGDIPAPVARHAADIVLDTIGVAVGAAARAHHSGAICEAYVLDRRGRSPAGEATLWSGQGAALADDAALCNGTWAEVLDYQDVVVDPRNNGHAGVAIVPASLAVAELVGADGAAFLTALVAGFQVSLAVLRALGRNHRNAGRGFRTSTLAAPLGATVACGRLLDLGRDQVLDALGIAGACAVSGLMPSLSPAEGRFGMDKDLANGLSAELAVRAARLAARGMTGSHAVITGDRGVLASHGHGDATPLGLPAGGVPDLAAVALKKYPASYGVHACVEALLGLMEEHGLKAADIVHIVARVKADSASSLSSRVLANHMAARFSLPYAIASAAVRQHCVIDDFEAAAIGDAAVRAMMDRVEVVADPALTEFHRATGGFPGEVEIRTPHATLRRRIDYPVGSAQRPMSRDEMAAKFHALTAGHLVPATQSALIAAIAGLGDIGDVRTLTRLLARL